MGLGELRVVKPKREMSVFSAFYQILPLGSINPDNGCEIQVHVKNHRGKMLQKNYGASRVYAALDNKPVSHVIMKADEYIIVVA